MNNIKTTIIMIGLIMVVVGTTLAPIQSYATGSGGFSGTSSLKHGIRDGVTVNLEHRSQHMDQENLCYRANTCRQANDGQNTLGNDNSVTGFTDQSDNLQAATTPGNNTAPGNNTTPTPTPTPTPRTCEECFATLNSTQTTALLGNFSQSSLASLCTLLGATPISEVAFITILTGPSVGVSPTMANELVACLKAAGIVFNP
jgi:hypothetical protein